MVFGLKIPLVQHPQENQNAREWKATGACKVQLVFRLTKTTKQLAWKSVTHANAVPTDSQSLIVRVIVEARGSN